MANAAGSRRELATGFGLFGLALVLRFAYIEGRGRLKLPTPDADPFDAPTR